MVYSYETTETKTVLREIADFEIYPVGRPQLVGKKSVAFRPPYKCDRYIHHFTGDVYTAICDFEENEPRYIVAPDNAYGKFLEDIKIPEGYELDGKNLADAFRFPTGGETIIGVDFLTPFTALAKFHWDHKRLIIRKIKNTERFLVGKWKINGTGQGSVSQSAAVKLAEIDHYSIVEEEV